MDVLIVFILVVGFGSIGWITARLATDDDRDMVLLGTLVGIALGAALGFLLVQGSREAAAWIKWCDDMGGRLEGEVCVTTDKSYLPG